MADTSYPLIADHGLIGDLQTAALVATDGSVDWFCAPRFDSPSIFGALLDHEQGGRFRIRPRAATFATTQLYFPDTAILVTRFMTEEGVGEVVDFMPVSGRRRRPTGTCSCGWCVACAGRWTSTSRSRPASTTAVHAHQTHLTEDGVVFTCNGTAMTLHVVSEPDDERARPGHRGRRRPARRR